MHTIYSQVQRVEVSHDQHNPSQPRRTGEKCSFSDGTPSAAAGRERGHDPAGVSWVGVLDGGSLALGGSEGSSTQSPGSLLSASSLVCSTLCDGL